MMKRWIWWALIVPLLAQDEGGKPATVVLAAGWRTNHDLKRSERLTGTEALSGSQDAGDLILDCGEAGSWAYACIWPSCSFHPCVQKAPGVVVRQVAPASPGLWASLFRREPKAPVTLGVRAGGNPADAVVQQDAQGVHWAPALTRVLEGRYCFRLSPLPPGASGSARDFTLDWDRSVESEGIGRVPGLVPGMYALEKGTPDSAGKCQLDPDLTAAWIVVVSEANFVRASKEWKQRSAWLGELEQSGASPAVVSTARHAALASLADSLERK